MHQKPFLLSSISLKVGLALFWLIASGCSTSKEPQQQRQPFANGIVNPIHQDLIPKACHFKPKGKVTYRKNEALNHLTKAYLFHAQGIFEKAIPHYEKALDAINYHKSKSAIESLDNLHMDEQALDFSGQMYEQLLARFYLALTQLHCGQAQASLTSLRQHEHTSHLLQDNLQQVAFLSHVQLHPNPVARYLIACHLEMLLEFDEAISMYQSAWHLTKAPFIAQDLKKIGKRSKKAWLIVIVHKDLIPLKKSHYVVAATASTLALEAFFKGKKIDPIWDTITGLSVPCYQESPQLCANPKLYINDELIAFYQGYDLAKAARAELSQTLPVLAAKALARQVKKYNLVHEHFTNQQASTRADLLLLFANIKSQADTRFWSLVPASIDFIRVDLEPGTYRVKLHNSASQEIKLDPGINLIEIFAPKASWLQTKLIKACLPFGTSD